MAIKVSGTTVIDGSRNIINVGNVDGRDVSVDGAKLDGIEVGATADQTAAEIRALVESATDSNVFTDADHTKLNNIEASADVTDAGNVNPLVDAHLNTGTATTGEYLSWTGADYDWTTAVSLAGETDSASPFETSLGVGAGAVNTGANNTFIGYDAGNDNTTGNTNTSVGFEALATNTTGGSNVGVGSEAGKFNFTGGGNVSVGAQSLRGVSGNSNSGNTAIGFQAGVGITTGGSNFFGGYRAGFSNTTASDNVAVGHQALDANTTGTQNVAMGSGALGGSTTGFNNVAVGHLTLDANTAGTDNVAIGGNAMGAQNAAYSSVAIGASAAGAYTGSNAYVAVGYQAFNGSGGLVESVGVGHQVGSNMTSGQWNVFLGHNTARQRTGGSNNVFLGYVAGSASGATGGNNVGIGTRVLEDATTASDNVVIGNTTGDQITTGTQNTVLGASAASSGANDLTTGSNNTVLGYNAAASSATVSNEITLGNTSVTRFRIPGAGIDNTSAALSGTTPSVDAGARDTYTLTTSGNTTFTFTGAPAAPQVGTFSLIITSAGAHTLTWPASVKWAGGTAPDAPASGETDVYTFTSINAGTTWYGFLAGDAMA